LKSSLLLLPKDDPHWKDRDKYPASFVLDELRCIYCGMCEEACPVDAIELTSVYDLTGMTREEMLFDKEKLLSVFDETVNSGKDPVRTNRGQLGPASEIAPTANQGPPPPGEDGQADQSSIHPAMRAIVEAPARATTNHVLSWQPTKQKSG
jgi:ferredoxin